MEIVPTLTIIFSALGRTTPYPLIGCVFPTIYVIHFCIFFSQFFHGKWSFLRNKEIVFYSLTCIANSDMATLHHISAVTCLRGANS